MSLAFDLFGSSREAERALVSSERFAAEVHPDSWQELFADTLPKTSMNPESLVKELSAQDLKVKDQARIFSEKTGLKVRAFYDYRKDAKISRSKDL